jgi:integrase
MFPLPHGCYASGSGPAVHPKNWKNKNASIKHMWYMSYWFYDPSIPKKKQIIVKGGVNEYKTLENRQLCMEALLAKELEVLQSGYNPIKEMIVPVEHEVGEITTRTPFIKALRFALSIKECEHNTKIDIESMLKYFEQSAIMLGKSSIAIKDVKRKDIRLILDNCKNVKVISKNGNKTTKIWNSNQFNHYRKYLSALYFELEELEIVEYNPVEKIAKKEGVEKLRYVPSEQERKKISDHLLNVHPNLLRFVNIFFHSGSRRSELFKLKGCDVDLINQRFKTIIKKGKKKREVWKTIKDVAMPFWLLQMKNCMQDDFVFSLNLQPGKRSIRPEYVTRHWKKHVKQRLGIKANFYSLKHLHTTEVEDYLETLNLSPAEINKAAADHNSHTTEAMVVAIYDVKHQQRKHNRVKGIKNTFAG